MRRLLSFGEFNVMMPGGDGNGDGGGGGSRGNSSVGGGSGWYSRLNSGTLDYLATNGDKDALNEIVFREGGYGIEFSKISNYISYKDGGEKYYRDDHESITDAKGVDQGNMYTDWILILNRDKVKAEGTLISGEGNLGSKPIFGTTIAIGAENSQNLIGGVIGTYVLGIKVNHYSLIVNNSLKGYLNFNTTIRNLKKDHDISIDVGSFSASKSLTSWSIGLNDYSFSVDGSPMNGLTIGIGHTLDNGNIQGNEVNINPFKLVPAVVGGLYYVAPYISKLAPFFL